MYLPILLSGASLYGGCFFSVCVTAGQAKERVWPQQRIRATWHGPIVHHSCPAHNLHRFCNASPDERRGVNMWSDYPNPVALNGELCAITLVRRVWNASPFRQAVLMEDCGQGRCSGVKERRKVDASAAYVPW
eukprot:4479944-Amphidinium_carterae.1